MPLCVCGYNQEWNAFTYETSQYYGLDLTGLSRQYEDEQRQYYMLSSAWAELKTEQVTHITSTQEEQEHKGGHRTQRESLSVLLS